MTVTCRLKDAAAAWISSKDSPNAANLSLLKVLTGRAGLAEAALGRRLFGAEHRFQPQWTKKLRAL